MHELFPEEPESTEIGFIHVTRQEGGGRFVYCPTLFAAEDLENLDAIHRLFGGGSYELIARSHDRSQVTTRRRVTLPGPARPLIVQDASALDAAPPLPAQSAAKAPVGSSDLFMLMMQQQQAAQAQLFQLMIAQQAENSKILVAALSRRENDPTGPVVQAVASLAGQGNAQMAQLLTALVQQRSGGGGDNSAEMLVKGMQIAHELKEASGGGGSGELGSLLQSVSIVADATKAVADAKIAEAKAAERAAE